ncbi:MAG: DUF1080 domain-containing protein [Planctomycetes bacterium]|nr:DUF1080 domain-containing protein [Planctomycetota bacterium]
MAHRILGIALFLLIATNHLTVHSAEEDLKKKAFLTEKEAGSDFKIQGEYSGKISTKDGDRSFGLQVISLGGGKFRAVSYPGGLPGDGWNGEEKSETEGEMENGAALFRKGDAVGIAKDGILTVKNSNNVEVGTFKKVIRKSSTLGKKAPQGAVVLFDGTSPKNFQGGRMTKDGLLMQGVTSHQKFQSYALHLEFMISYMPYARGQGRGNSGCYMQGRYEVQILDSFGLEGKNNECGGLYEIKDPAVNMCYPPLSWQTYDIDYTAAKFDENGKKTANARITVRHNGVVIHDDVELPRSTRGAPVKEGPEPGPIYIQDHRNPIRFRNIWLVEKK